MSAVCSDRVCLFYGDIKPILDEAELLAIKREWGSEEEKTEYLKIASAFKEKIAEAGK